MQKESPNDDYGRAQDDSHDPGRDGSQSQLEKIRKPHETLFMKIEQTEK